MIEELKEVNGSDRVLIFNIMLALIIKKSIMANPNLSEEVKNNKFRQDLYFRLKTINIDVLPLRDHLSDLHLFIERFGLQFTAKNDIPFKGFSSEALGVLKRYSWPGNVRELKNAVESLLVMNRGERITDKMVNKH